MIGKNAILLAGCLAAIGLSGVANAIELTKHHLALKKRITCQRGVSPEAPRQTTTRMTGNLPLETTIPVLYKNDLYQIKLGYILAWGVPESPDNPNGFKLGNPNEFSALSFSFWMPSLRYQEVNELSYRSHRPCENGRPIPEAESDEYIVKVYMKDVPVGDRPITPELTYKRLFDSDELKKRHENYHGLTQVIRIDSPLPFNDHYFRLNSSPQVYIQCTKPEHDVPNPTCLGKFYYPDTKNYMEISFPPDALSEWKAILSTAQELPKKWQAETTRGNPSSGTRYQ